MSWKSLAVFIFVCGTTLALDNELSRAQRSSEIGILKLMSRSNKLLARNPNQSLGCFSYYTPIMNEIMVTYEDNYNVCVGIADKARKAADATTVQQREELAADAAIACVAVNQCKSEAEAESGYQCYIDGGSKSSKALNNLSSDASGKLVVFQKTLRSISSDENICVTENRLQYEKDWNKVYDEFTDCINGLIDVPASSTQAPSSAANLP